MFLVILGVTTDMRLEDGVQSETVYPSVGLALGLQDDAFASLQECLGKVEPEPRDGAVYECRLVESETPYVIVPFIEARAGPRDSEYTHAASFIPHPIEPPPLPPLV